MTATLDAASDATPPIEVKWSADLQVGPGCVTNADGAFVALVTAGTYGLAIGVFPAQTALVELRFGNDGGVTAIAPRQGFYDYQNNVKSYPKWQQWLRDHHPPLLVLWGRYDTSFTVAGGEAYRKDDPRRSTYTGCGALRTGFTIERNYPIGGRLHEQCPFV